MSLRGLPKYPDDPAHIQMHSLGCTAQSGLDLGVENSWSSEGTLGLRSYLHMLYCGSEEMGRGESLTTSIHMCVRQTFVECYYEQSPVPRIEGEGREHKDESSISSALLNFVF